MRSLAGALSALVVALAPVGVPAFEGTGGATGVTIGQAAKAEGGTAALAPDLQRQAPPSPRSSTPTPVPTATPAAISLDRHILRAQVRTPPRAPRPIDVRRRVPPRLELGEPPDSPPAR